LKVIRIRKPSCSCSFVEFVGHGDYIEFEQHQDAWHKVRELADRQPLLLVTYCHGWKNNSQSSDVVKFNDFLGRLAASKVIAGAGYRVQRRIPRLAWKPVRPYVEKDGETHAYDRTAKRFGEPIVSPQWSRRFVWTAWLHGIRGFYTPSSLLSAPG
jgi:hypothetical protein